MATGQLKIDLDALAANWRALDRLSAVTVETGAVVKADGYGLGAEVVSKRLAQEGVRQFFVAVAEEGVTVRKALGPGPEIYVFSGHCEGDGELIAQNALVPLLNSPEQVARHLASADILPFGIQLDSGMNRLGIEPEDWQELRTSLSTNQIKLVMSHLACADETDHDMNRSQLNVFKSLTQNVNAPLSLSATGGILLGPDYHFSLTRPGVGLYGGAPFDEAEHVVELYLPVIQHRELEVGETVGYGNAWTAKRPSRIATVSSGYADGLIRAGGNIAMLFADGVACPVVGRISMDLITVDVTEIEEVPDALEILGPSQSVDDLADAAGTIGYEILTSLGGRYVREYRGRAA